MSSIPTVLFVCEHGAAKSVVAATHFNRLARERHMQLRAIARGTDPAPEIVPNAINGLQAEGLTLDDHTPRRLSSTDVAQAMRVVSFCELPHEYGDHIPVVRWNDVPPVSENYARARNVIVENVARPLDDLVEKEKNA
jgi:Protein-tyrosine-phosphatase